MPNATPHAVAMAAYSSPWPVDALNTHADTMAAREIRFDVAVTIQSADGPADDSA